MLVLQPVFTLVSRWGPNIPYKASAGIFPVPSGRLVYGMELWDSSFGAFPVEFILGFRHEC